MNVEITIRRATQQDCEALCRIHVASIRGLGRSHYSEADVDAWSRGRTPERYEEHIAERYVIIAQQGSNPVGFGTMDYTTGEIRQVYVSPDYARKGVGRRILGELQAEARNRGLRELHCMASLNAEAFYTNFGFHAGQKCKVRFGTGGEIDCIPMNKKLEPQT